jgi:ribonuclease P protein component
MGSSGKPSRDARDSHDQLRVRGQQLPKRVRIRSQGDFDALYHQGKVAVDAVLVVHAIPSRQGASRLAISIPKRTGHAPLRNRWKRLIREAYRKHRPRKLRLELDLLVRPRRGAQPDFQRVEQSLLSLCTRLARQLAQDATAAATRPTADEQPTGGGKPNAGEQPTADEQPTGS